MILDEILNILKTSNDKAYTLDGKSYTYRDLYKYVCNIYYFLLENNKSKNPVVVYGHKEVYMKASFLACSFAGMPYVPIDIGTPDYRVEQIIKQVSPGLIIGRDIPPCTIYEIMNKENYKEISKIFLKSDNLVYIIFTSGSSGTAKGVKITYKNLDSCVNWLKKITNIKKCVILNQANFSFDLSVADLYLSLISGSEHFIINNPLSIDFKLTFNQLKTSNANLAVMTPSFADLLLLDKSFGKKILPNLKTILFCGEKLLSSTVTKLNNRFDNLNIINSYGPTECTFAVTSIKLNGNVKNEEEIPIGIPKEDINLYIVDKNLNKLPDGKKGEILIVGENSVGNGYLNEVLNNPFINYNGKKAYLTGDLGYIKDKTVYYVARKDKQIKFRGYRIELSDIEKNLQKLAYIDKSVVIPRIDNKNKVQSLIAFVKLKKNKNKTDLEIRKDLQKLIPLYMCPKIKIINNFPLNPNGKCDEKKLMEEL